MGRRGRFAQESRMKSQESRVKGEGADAQVKARRDSCRIQAGCAKTPSRHRTVSISASLHGEDTYGPAGWRRLRRRVKDEAASHGEITYGLAGWRRDAASPRRAFTLSGSAALTLDS